MRLTGAGQCHHGKALSIVGQVVVNFVGRITSGNEKDSIQPKTALRCPRRCQVSGMDGVKRSAENCDVHEIRFIGPSEGSVSAGLTEFPDPPVLLTAESFIRQIAH